MSQVTYTVDLSGVTDELRHEVFRDIRSTDMDFETPLEQQLLNVLEGLNHLRMWGCHFGGPLEDPMEDAIVMLLPTLAKLREET